MRILIAVIVVAVIGWSGYWWVNASLRRGAVEDWFAARAAEGWVAEYGDLRVTGFPNRVDTILTDVELADPDSGWAWSGPRFEMLTLSYQPFEIIAVWPGQHVLSSPYDRIAVEGETLRASLAVSANGAFELERSRIEGRDVLVEGQSGWVVEVPVLDVATEQPEGLADDGTVQRLGINMTDLRLSDDLTDGFDRTGLLPDRVEEVRVDATATFGSPISLRTLEQDLPPLTALSIDDITAIWGRLDLRAQGELAADARGYAEGDLNVRARNWEDMVALAVENGLIQEGAARTVTFGLGLLASAGGDRNTLNAPLSFEDGRTRLGPVAIGEAPRLSR
ncbi:DUF2125 domain-containing protein [Roseobacter sp. HKCCA0434]|uniref:DUF2125 domain-containing protein n=1 Tax=Roseobacter sp. HKCCA0434 TaxID=3079297 RepID=UPI0029059565|nr:DUF2125 domain-containing protein [Roseobacter sp. HKCCA0434]